MTNSVQGNSNQQVDFTGFLKEKGESLGQPTRYGVEFIKLADPSPTEYGVLNVKTGDVWKSLIVRNLKEISGDLSNTTTLSVEGKEYTVFTKEYDLCIEGISQDAIKAKNSPPKEA